MVGDMTDLVSLLGPSLLNSLSRGRDICYLYFQEIGTPLAREVQIAVPALHTPVQAVQYIVEGVPWERQRATPIWDQGALLEDHRDII